MGRLPTSEEHMPEQIVKTVLGLGDCARGFNCLVEIASGMILAVAKGEHIIRRGDIVASNGTNPDVPVNVKGVVTQIRDPNSNTRIFEVWFDLNPRTILENAWYDAADPKSKQVHQAYMKFDELNFDAPHHKRDHSFL